MKDLNVVVDSYRKHYRDCEQKYQISLKGDMDTSFEIKGRMRALEEDIREILKRYPEEKIY